MTTLEDIREEYAIDENGIVQSPGKFESEHWSTIALWESMMDGFVDETFYDEDDSPIDVFLLTDDDRKEFGFDASVYAVLLSENSVGFAHGETMTESEYDLFVEEVQQEEDEDY